MYIIAFFFLRLLFLFSSVIREWWCTESYQRWLLSLSTQTWFPLCCQMCCWSQRSALRRNMCASSCPTSRLSSSCRSRSRWICLCRICCMCLHPHCLFFMFFLRCWTRWLCVCFVMMENELNLTSLKSMLLFLCIFLPMPLQASNMVSGLVCVACQLVFVMLLCY